MKNINLLTFKIYITYLLIFKDLLSIIFVFIIDNIDNLSSVQHTYYIFSIGNFSYNYF